MQQLGWGLQPDVNDRICVHILERVRHFRTKAFTDSDLKMLNNC